MTEVEMNRFRRFWIDPNDMLSGVAQCCRPDGGSIGFVRTVAPYGVATEQPFPAATLLACAGKPILEVIDHPVTRERYGPGDVVERAFWDDEAQVSVFEIRRAA